MNVKNTAAQKIAETILLVQKKFADAMYSITKKWKAKQQLIFLYMLCLVLGGLSVIAIIKPFNDKKNFLEKPASIRLPKLIRPNEDQGVITDKEITKIHLFKQRMDSLNKTKSGKLKTEQLFKRRPGLFDSLEMVEQLYYSQKK